MLLIHWVQSSSYVLALAILRPSITVLRGIITPEPLVNEGELLCIHPEPMMLQLVQLPASVPVCMLQSGIVDIIVIH
jgi:hypothetical protein